MSTELDLCGPLPGPGRTLVEASAGTGKTYALTALVVRYVAAGTPLDQLLAVTFTRMATGELRDRIRRRLADTAAALQERLATGAAPTGVDEVTALLCGAPEGEVARTARRLGDAVAGFDAATVATTHGFCQLVLAGLGTAGDVAAGTTLLEDPSDLVEQVAGDLYLRWALQAGPPGFDAARAARAAAAAVANPGTCVVPEGGSDPDALLARLARAADAEVGRRLRAADLLTYDQLLARLLATLGDPDRGPRACERLRHRWRVVLVDEFQDTDPVQWEIVERAFGAPPTTLVLVGDPKQAIYSFRGADVHAYLAAARSSTRRHLSTNRRADQPLLDGLDALLRPLELGHPEITYLPVHAPPDRQAAGLRGAPHPAPLRLRRVDATAAGLRRTPKGNTPQKGQLATWIAGDVADDIARLLASGATLPDDLRGRRPVERADVAVLTRTHLQSTAVRDALLARGVNAVAAGLDPVFESPAAAEWLRLLQALAEPGVRSRAAAAALTPFVGMDAAGVALAPEATWDDLHARLHGWAGLLAGQGVAALWRALLADPAGSLPARVLATAGGERRLTDLGHVAELLHAEATASGLTGPSLLAWLTERVRLARGEAAAEERSRRLERDGDAVTVLTVHAAKGLEWPVVHCAYLWDPGRPTRGSDPVTFHDPDDGRRKLDVLRPDEPPAARAASDRRRRLGLAERRGEDLRLLYVALTRARHQVVLWWGRGHECRQSPLGRLLCCRDATTGAVGDASGAEPTDRQIQAAFEEVAARAPAGAVAVEVAGARPPEVGPPAPAAGAGADLGVAHFGRVLDLAWRRSSYTSITAGAHHGTGAVGSEPEVPGTGDEPGDEGAEEAAADPHTATDQAAGAAPPAGDPWAAARHVPCPLAGMPAGPDAGTAVHRLLELVDLAAGDPAAEVASALAAGPAWASPLGTDRELVAAGLAAALATPLGDLHGGAPLAGIARADRLDELGFELPVAGGDRAGSAAVPTGAIAEVIRRHLPAGDPLAGYPDQLADPVLATELRGYLTGSIDLVWRRPGPAGRPRWHLADHKTNRLGSGELTAWDYRPEALDAEMRRRHYPLQALLYLVALHRYLRWRQPGYDVGDLGAVSYLFLRGMVGPGAPAVRGRVAGVWSWAVPPGLVTDLDELLATGVTR